ncbi:MAG: hypothetical protein R6V55_12865 [Desulfovermiculus sp.]
MTAIHTLQAFDQTLCIFRISGPIKAQTLLSLARQAQSAHPSSPMHMWDFTHGALRFEDNEYDRVLSTTHQPVSETRTGGIQTALVCPNELDHGLFRLVHTFSLIGRYPRQIRAFRCMRAAQRWLGACTLCKRMKAQGPELKCARTCSQV